MSTPTPQEMTLDAIRSVPLFASLDDAAAGELRDLLRTRQAAAGTALFRAGDKGDAMYLIESGRIRISISDEDKKEIVLAELAQGDFFGEMAIIDGKQRSADEGVIEEARLAVLSREDFLRFIRNNPTVALEMLSATFTRLRRTKRSFFACIEAGTLQFDKGKGQHLCVSACPGGGIGRRAGFRYQWRKPWRFESSPGHH